MGGYEAQEGTAPLGSSNAKPALSLYIRITRILTHVPPKLNPRIREWRMDRILVRSLPLAKANGRTSAACIFVRIPRNLTRSSIAPRSGKGGRRLFPPVLLAASLYDVEPLGVSGVWV